MFLVLVFPLVIALATGRPSHNLTELVRQKRNTPSSLLKTGASIVTPIISNGLKSALGMTSGSYDDFKEAAKKESTEGRWLTANFVDLLFTPTISLLTNQIKDLNLKLQNISQTIDSFSTAIFSLAGIVPTLTLLLVILCFVNGRRTQLVKRDLRKADRSIELLRSATTGRLRASGRRAASPPACEVGVRALK